MLNKKMLDLLFLSLCFSLIVGIFVGKEAGFISKNYQEYQSGVLAISTPGRDKYDDIEENLVYFPGFRGVYDFKNAFWGDDYIYENRDVMQPTPLGPKLLGGLFLILARGNNDECLILIHIFAALAFIVMYKVLRAADIPPHWSLLIVAFVLFQNRATDFTRFIAPALTLHFFFLFLLYLFKDPLIQNKKSCFWIGLMGALNFYIYYSNFFVIAMALSCYLFILFFLYPTHRKHYLLTFMWYVIFTVPFVVIYLASKQYLPADYILKIGMSKMSPNIRTHWAWFGAKYTLKNLLIFVFLPVGVITLPFFIEKKNGGERINALLSFQWKRVSSVFNAYRLYFVEKRNLLLIVFGIICFIVMVIPGILQFLINIPQPAQVKRRLGVIFPAFFYGMVFFYIWNYVCKLLGDNSVWKKISQSKIPRVAVYGMGVFLLAGVFQQQWQKGENQGKDLYVLDKPLMDVVDYLNEQSYPCVLSSNERMLPFHVVSRTHCDILAPNIITSSVSSMEAVDRFIAIKVLEQRELNEVLDYFRLSVLGPGDKYREVCHRNGPGSTMDIPIKNQQTDGLGLAFHHGPCEPYAVRDFIRERFQEYNEYPNIILQKYRVDYIYSAQNQIHTNIANEFSQTEISGLYQRIRGGNEKK
ncbi:MAG: hypothetical protein KAR05_02165 [Candidatus Omnitrophica bacterium]|nr:hypothetical protein [Candidatus Omnitrophota bacterium]